MLSLANVTLFPQFQIPENQGFSKIVLFWKAWTCWPARKQNQKYHSIPDFWNSSIQDSILCVFNVLLSSKFYSNYKIQVIEMYQKRIGTIFNNCFSGTVENP